MDATDKEKRTMEAFEALGKVVKEEVFAALEAHDFEKGRQLTGLMEELVGLQGRVREALGGRVVEAAVASGAAKAPGSARIDSDDYPRFFRRGSILVKHGERRDGDGIYEQKVPRETYDEILQQLRAVKGSKAEFRAPEVLKRVSCPDYQVYLVLNVLQKEEYLESPQRGLYRFAKRHDSPWAGKLWERVPEDTEATTH